VGGHTGEGGLQLSYAETIGNTEGKINCYRSSSIQNAQRRSGLRTVCSHTHKMTWVDNAARMEQKTFSCGLSYYGYSILRLYMTSNGVIDE
jgi:hypothetical protein